MISEQPDILGMNCYMNVFAIVRTTSPERMMQNIVATNNSLPSEDRKQFKL